MASNYLGFPVFYRESAGQAVLISTNRTVAASATDVDITNNKILKTGHAYENGDLLLYTAGTAAIGGLTGSNYYFVVNKTANDFQVSATEGGSAIDLTSTGTGNQTFTPAVAVKVRAAAATADVSESPLKTNVDGEIAAGSFAAVAVGTKVHFRVENYRAKSVSAAQLTT